ncbi:MAG: hypothetical protein V7637_5615 [Mycobacteriales bacterium]|jgi:hypothetical protein
MRLLFLALTPYAYGETADGVQLAHQLRELRADCHFVVQPSCVEPVLTDGYPCTMVEPSMGGHVVSVIGDLVRSFRPDAIILSDYFMYWVQVALVFGVEPWFIEEYGLPIIPIDLWEWENTDFKVDPFGDLVLEVNDRILTMDVHLRPVPLAHLDSGPAGRGYPYRRRGGTDRVSDLTRGVVFDQLGMRRTDRLLLLPLSLWQEPPPYLPPAAVRLGQHLPDLLVHYLRQLPDSTHFLIIGPRAEAFSALPPARTHLIAPTSAGPACPPRRYSTLLGSADAVLALQLTSTAVMRGVFADVSGLALTNGFALTGESDVDRLAAATGGVSDYLREWLAGLDWTVEEFSYWPMKLRSLARPVLTDNPFLGAVAEAEILDEAAVVGQLTRMLYGPATRERLAQARSDYVRAVDALPSTADVFTAAGRKLGMDIP